MANTVTVLKALEKLKFLATTRTAAERGGYNTNFSAFAARIAEIRNERGHDQEIVRNYRNTLETAAKNDKIDADTEIIVGEICGFDIKSIAWRTGSKKDFEDEFEGAQFKVERRSSWSIHRTISVDLMFSENRAAAWWPFDVDVVCQKATIDEVGQTIIVNRATLEIYWDSQAHPDAKVSRVTEREEFLAALTENLADRNVEVMVYGRDTQPAWELSNKNGQLLGIVPLPGLCRQTGFKDGLTLEARLIIYDKDLNTNDADETVEVEGPDAQGVDDTPDPILRPDGESLGANKRCVLQAITLRSLREERDQPAGSAIFAIDRISFVERKAQL